MKIRIGLFWTFLLACCAIAQGGNPARASMITPATLPDLVEKTLPGVVNISTVSVTRLQAPPGMEEFLRFWGVPESRKQSSLGSGFIIDEQEGIVLTNSHVVEGATEVMVSLQDKRSFRAKILGRDPKMDVALLKILEKSGKVPERLQKVPLGDSDKVRIAESVFAVGNPFSLQHTVTVGIISAKNRTIGIGPFDNFLQTDASINPGNSGGPLFNLTGEVIGMNTAIFSRTGQSGGLGFAIPINEVKRIVPELKKYGRVPRPWLGILGERVTSSLEQYYDLPTSKGVLIYNLVQAGPAIRAGVKPGDIVVKMGDTQVDEPNDIERQLAKHRPGEIITLSILRGTKKLEIKINLREAPELTDAPQGIL